MKAILFATAATLSVLAAGQALAEESCHAPMDQWQPREALQQKLESEGMKVRRIKTENGCYEAYAIDAQGKRMESLYDPKTLALVKADDHDD